MNARRRGDGDAVEDWCWQCCLEILDLIRQAPIGGGQTITFDWCMDACTSGYWW